MKNEDSPIKRFYPEDFQTDLNGKEQEWEAVVLIPFIDELQLMDAMETCSTSLLEEVRGHQLDMVLLSDTVHSDFLVFVHLSVVLPFYSTHETLEVASPCDLHMYEQHTFVGFSGIVIDDTLVYHHIFIVTILSLICSHFLRSWCATRVGRVWCAAMTRLSLRRCTLPPGASTSPTFSTARSSKLKLAGFISSFYPGRGYNLKGAIAYMYETVHRKT